MYAGVYNGYITNEYGKPVKATDGTTPMENAENGTYGYFGEDGSFQWDISLTNNNREGTFFDMPIHIELKDLGYADKSDFEPLVEGTWSFDWVLTGSDEIKRVGLDVPLGDTGVKVTKAEISPISLSVWLKNKGFGTGEAPDLRGVKMKDGTLLPYLYLGPGAESPSYITFVIDRILDVDEVEALIFRKNYPEEGQAYTEEDLYIVPINE